MHSYEKTIATNIPSHAEGYPFRSPLIQCLVIDTTKHTHAPSASRWSRSSSGITLPRPMLAAGTDTHRRWRIAAHRRRVATWKSLWQTLEMD